METSLYLEQLNEVAIDSEKVEKIQKIYKTKLPTIMEEIISRAAETVFLNNDCRMLSVEEIEDAEEDLHVDFKEKCIIPVADCGENDFVVYHFRDDYWSKFNIIEEIEFDKSDDLKDILK